MAYNEDLADRIREKIAGQPHFTEKKMFGGLSFMYKGKMSVGIMGDDLMVRVLPEKISGLLSRKHIGLMAFTGKPMKEFVLVKPEGWSSETSLEEFIRLGLEHANWKAG